jgi:hypothetical protein
MQVSAIMMNLALAMLGDQTPPPDLPMDTPLFPVYVWLTFAGVVVNAVVAILIWRQGTANRIAADAAKASAEALMAAERALLVIFYDNYLHVDNAGKAPDERALLDSKDSDHIFNWRVVNTGKTPAFLTRVVSCLIEIKDLDELPDDPDYSRGTEKSNIPEPLAFGDKSLWFSTKLESNPKYGGASHIEIEDRFRSQKTCLYAYGNAQYMDVFGSYRETRFGYVYEAQTQFSRQDGWKIAGPEAYNAHK